MLVKTFRFVSLLCAALALGLTLTHDLEIPGKQLLRGADWLIVQQTFYGGFAIVGGIVEILGLLSTGVLLVLLCRQRAAFAFTLVAAISFGAMLAVFAFGNNPLNQHIAAWTPATLPACSSARCARRHPRLHKRADHLRNSGMACEKVEVPR